MSAPTASYDNCLLGPTEQGFAPICVESYVATIDIKVYERSFPRDKLVEDRSFKNSALEFGGEFICPGFCDSEMARHDEKQALRVIE